MRIVTAPDQLAEAVASAPARGRLRVRRRHRLPRTLRRLAPPHRGADPRRHVRRGRPPLRARMLDPAALPEDHRGGALPRGRRRAARRVVRRRRRRGQGDRLRRRRHGRVRARRVRALLLPRGQHPAAGRAPGHRDDHRPRPRRAAAPHRLRAAASRQGARGNRPGSRDRGPALRRRRPGRIRADQRRRAHADVSRRGSGRRRVRRRHPGQHVLRLDAGEGDRLRRRPRRGPAHARRRAVAGPDPRRRHQPRPARRRAARAGVRGRRDRHRLPDAPPARGALR